MSEPYSSSPPDSPIHPTPRPSTYLANGYGHPYSLVFPRALKSAPRPPGFSSPAPRSIPILSPETLSAAGQVRRPRGNPGRRSWLHSRPPTAAVASGEINSYHARLSQARRPPGTQCRHPRLPQARRRSWPSQARRHLWLSQARCPRGTQSRCPRGNQHRHPRLPQPRRHLWLPQALKLPLTQDHRLSLTPAQSALQCQPLKSTLQSPLLNSALRCPPLLCDCPIKPLLSSRSFVWGGSRAPAVEARAVAEAAGSPAMASQIPCSTMTARAPWSALEVSPIFQSCTCLQGTGGIGTARDTGEVMLGSLCHQSSHDTHLFTISSILITRTCQHSSTPLYLHNLSSSGLPFTYLN